MSTDVHAPVFRYRYGLPVSVLGATGTGKTVWLQYLAIKLPRVVIYDLKQSDGWEKIMTVRVTSPSGLEKALKTGGFFRILYQPPTDIIMYEDQTREDFDAVCKAVLRAKNIALICDELALAMGGKNPTPGFRGLVATGRSRGVNVVGATQRNQDIPNILITQAREIIVFTLSDYDIRAYEWLHGVELAGDLGPYEWIHISMGHPPVIKGPVPFFLEGGEI